MCVPHRDDAPRASAQRPNHNDQPAAKIADGDAADFAVVLAVIGQRGVKPREYRGRVGEIQPSLRERRGALGCIIRMNYCNYVYCRCSRHPA
jgi:hypothetical protein